MKIFLLGLLPYLVECANILVLEPVPSPSHHVWMKTITYALAERGHNVTSLSADIEEGKPENLHYLHLDKIYEVLYDGSDDMNYVELGKSNAFIKTLVFVTFSMRALEGSIISKGYKQLLDYPDDFRFDLIIYDFVIGPLLLPFATKFPKTPIIGATAYSSAGFTMPVVGGVLTPAFVPYIFYPSELDTFIDRLNNFVFNYLDYMIRMYYIAPRIHSAMGHNFPKLKDVRELEKTAKLVLINKDPVHSVPEQSLPNVISVGGLQVQRTKSLPEDLSTILNGVKNGAVLFSLGTNVMGDMVKNDILTEILEAFRALTNYTILIKIDIQKTSVTLPSNVEARTWLPQNDVLAHPNVKLFVTHCGLLSIQEALWHGVPMLCIPLFADGFDNARLLVNEGVAEQQDFMKIERNSFKRLMEQILEDPKYRENAQARSRAFRDQKETPLERAVWWTEFILRHPNMTLMRSQSLNQGYFKRNSWDILVFFYSLFLISTFFTYKLICLIYRKMVTKQLVKDKKQ